MEKFCSSCRSLKYFSSGGLSCDRCKLKSKNQREKKNNKFDFQLSEVKVNSYQNSETFDFIPTTTEDLKTLVGSFSCSKCQKNCIDLKKLNKTQAKNSLSYSNATTAIMSGHG